MCDDFVIMYKDNKLSDKFLNAIFGKTKRAEKNEIAIHSMEYIFRQTEYNVDLLINESTYNSDLKSLIEDLPFCRIVLYNKYSQITARLLTGDLTYVVDENPYRIGLINNSNVITLDKLNQIIKTRR